MRIRIDMSVNLAPEIIEAFRVWVGEPTESALREYILAHGVKNLELLQGLPRPIAAAG